VSESAIELYQRLLEQLEGNAPCATATIIGRSGSIPAQVGASILVGTGGERLAGTVGGGQIEYRVLQQCAEAIAEGEHRRFSYQLSDEEAGGIGMMCGGRAEVFIEVHQPAPQLVLVGAGHVNLEVARLAARLDYAVTVIDDRAEWANAENYPGARLLHLDAEQAYAQIAWRGEDFVVIGTRDRDLPALRAAIDLPCRYIGVVASRRKAILLVRQLSEQGVDVSKVLGRLCAPIGLDTGGRGPADIAVSIIAQIQQLRHGTAGGALGIAAEDLQRHAGRSG
jgi:xanthine dehydrogenase accessory factor